MCIDYLNTPKNWAYIYTQYPKQVMESSNKINKLYNQKMLK